MEEQMVKEQLRAGSILEAIRIRKIGFGYRMEYQSFAELFWPIYGQRIWEAGREEVEIIFKHAS